MSRASKIPLGSIPKYDDIKRVFDSEESTLQWLVKKRVLQIPVFLGKSKMAFHHSVLVAYLWLAGFNIDSMHMVSGCPKEDIESWIYLCRRTVCDELKDIPSEEGEDLLLAGERIWMEENKDKLWDAFLTSAVRSVNRQLQIDEAHAPIDLEEGPDYGESPVKQDSIASIDVFAALTTASSFVMDPNELFKTINNASETAKKTLGSVAFRLINGVDEIQPLTSGQTMHFGFDDVYEDDPQKPAPPSTMEEVAKTLPDMVPLVTGNDISVFDRLKASQAGFHDVYDEDSEGLFIYSGPSFSNK